MQTNFGSWDVHQHFLHVFHVHVSVPECVSPEAHSIVSVLSVACTATFPKISLASLSCVFTNISLQILM